MWGARRAKSRGNAKWAERRPLEARAPGKDDPKYHVKPCLFKAWHIVGRLQPIPCSQANVRGYCYEMRHHPRAGPHGWRVGGWEGGREGGMGGGMDRERDGWRDGWIGGRYGWMDD